MGNRLWKYSCHAIGLMNKYQYDAKSRTLEEAYGIQVKDFGRRRVEYGTSGHDVLVLQQFLIEEGYLNPDSDDGAHGYFGESTRGALQMWQRDVGIAPTGVLDDVSRSRYLQYLEDTLRMIGMVDTYNMTAPQRTLYLPLVGGVPVMAGMLAIIVRAWLKMKKTARFSATDSRFSDKKAVNSPSPLPSAPRSPRRADGAVKKLSKQELEKYIAPMKGQSEGMKFVEKKGKKGRKLGRYFGGRQVIEDIQRKMNGYPGTTQVIGSNIPSGRMEQVGYDMKDKYTSHYDTILDGTELDTRCTEKSSRALVGEQGMHDSTEHMVLDNSTIVLQNKPVKLHKPLKTSA